MKGLVSVGKIITLFIIGFIYFFLIATSVMGTDSCSPSNCKILEMALILSSIFLLTSFIVLVIYTYRKEKELPLIFRAYIALPIYFFIILFGSYLNDINQEKILKQEKQEIEQLVVSHISEVNGRTVEWTKYTNEQYGFSIEYPKYFGPVWGIDTDQTSKDEGYYFSTKDQALRIYITIKDPESTYHNSYLDLDEKCAMPDNECEYTQSEIDINGAKAFMDSYKDRSRYPHPIIHLENDAFVYRIESSIYGIPDADIYEQIIKSFKLLPQTNS